MAGAAPTLIDRYRKHLAAAALVALVLVQQPGRIASDTKADLVLDPAHFLGQALSAWNAQQGFGQLGNQSYGYLFPMGPFFLVGHLVGLPAWMIQRFWWALLLLLAYYGVLRIAEALSIGTPGARIAAALTYVLAPRVLTVLGGISVEAWPGALVPWALLPLVLARQGRLPPRRAAALSGVAVLVMGAVNAAATIAALLVPAIYLVSAARSREGRSLLAWWVGAIALATAWWVGPLLILGRYGFPFLDYIENAATTTSTTGILTTLRGAEHWGGYLVVGGSPRWPSGFLFAYGLLPFLCTCLVAALGLAGLCQRSMPDARWLRVSAVAGLVLIAAGHAGPFGGGFAAPVQAMLDGSLAAFRNVHKFDPVVRLPISLGVAHALGVLLRSDRRSVQTRVRRRTIVLPPPAAIALVAALLGLTGALLPAVQVGVVPPGSYDSVPGYWSRTAAWLSARSGTGTALLVPSSSFAMYDWGRPLDEPLQALARTRWAVRDAVPLGAPGSYRVLDGIDALLAEGRPSEQIAPALARMGVDYVLLRNDIDPAASGSEPPWIVRASLVGSPGITRAAKLGPVEVFAVADPAPPVSAVPVSSAVTLTGGPEATIGVAGELGPDRAAVLASDPADTAAVVVTDTGLRRTLSFGYDDPNRIRRQLGDGNYEYAGLGDDLARYSPTEPAGGVPPRQYGPDVPDGLQTVSAVDGLDAVDASSSAADPFASHYRGVADRPAAAFDGDPSTAWISGTGGAVGQWLEARFTRPVFAADIGVRFVDDRDIGPSVAQVEVRTDAGTRRDPVARGRSPQFLALPAGSTSMLRITVTAVRGRPTGRQVGIAEIAVPGLTTRPELITARALPTALNGKPTAIRLDRAAGDRSECVSADPSYVCSTDIAHAGEDAVPATRIVRTPGPVGRSVGVTVRADGTSAELGAAIEKAAGVTVRASSTAVPALADGPLAVIDGNRATVWRPAAKDRRPSVSLHFAHPVAARDIALLGDLSGARSVELRVDARSVSLRPKAGRSQPADISGSDWTISMIRKGSAKHPDGRPVELSGIRLDARTLSTPPISTECGAGPAISVDGRQTDFAVTASVEAIMAGAEVTASPCSVGRIIAAGDHTIGLQDGGGWQVASAALGMAQLPTGAPRAVHVTSSSATRTAAVVGAGPRSYLQLTQSFNPGWQARYRGSPLRAVRLDGWRQGFVLPAAASAAAVTVSFRPEAWQALALGAGVAGVVVLGLLVVLPQRRRRRTVVSRSPAGRQTWRSDGRLTIVVVALAAVLGWILAGLVGAAVAVLVTVLPPRLQWAVAAGGMTVAAAAGVIAPGRAVAAFFAVLTMGALVAAAVRPAQDVTSSAP